MTSNAELQAKYEAMHTQGPTAWFSDGENEREAILAMGAPWTGKHVLEIGCGEGSLLIKISDAGAPDGFGVDYSEVAINKARSIPSKIPKHHWICAGHHHLAVFPGGPFDRVVMQGVLEHFDDPWGELEWIVDNLLVPGGDVITSSPCFINVRGIVWMTLATLFDAPMSLTDLHFLHPKDFSAFAKAHGMTCEVKDTDESWASGVEMVSDLRQRLPKVFPAIDTKRIGALMGWLDDYQGDYGRGYGATAVYHLRKPA